MAQPEYRYLLNTNIVSALVRDPQGPLTRRIARVGEHRVCTRTYLKIQMAHVAMRRARMQGAARRTVARPTAEGGNAADAPFSSQPFGAESNRALGFVAPRRLGTCQWSPRRALPTARFDSAAGHFDFEIGSSIVVACELRFGAIKRNSPRLTQQVAVVVEALPILPLDAGVDQRYGAIRAALEQQGTPIGANDMLIAAHAALLDLTLVTDNVREFSRVPGLTVRNWLRK
jgi:tRNA(fMet)-specific endonuclease VapC